MFFLSIDPIWAPYSFFKLFSICFRDRGDIRVRKLTHEKPACRKSLVLLSLEQNRRFLGGAALAKFSKSIKLFITRNLKTGKWGMVRWLVCCNAGWKDEMLNDHLDWMVAGRVIYWLAAG
jgi:hypothetical protein